MLLSGVGYYELRVLLVKAKKNVSRVQCAKCREAKTKHAQGKKKVLSKGGGVGGGSDNLHVCPTVCPPHCTLAYSCAK